MTVLARVTGVAMAGFLCGCAPAVADRSVEEVSLEPQGVTGELAPLARAIGDRRIVLLGENGHGVGEFTTAKVRLTEWLHRELGFDVVVMESGFFECGDAWRRAAELNARDLLYRCLRYPFEHAEALPLFELIDSRRGSGHPLVLAGMDFQPQGYDSGARPNVLHETLSPLDADLARRVAAFDSALFLVPDSGGMGEEVDQWILEHGAEARAAYDSAAVLTSGWDRWTFRLASGLVDRLAVRAEARAAGASELPGSYYELRDEWMARAVAAHADSIAGSRKLVVWLHNDHARYGDFTVGQHSIRSVGGFLREWHAEEVFSMGFFMGSGVVTNNSRRERTVAAPTPGGVESFLGAEGHRMAYLILSGNPDPTVQEWAGGSRPYLRMGLDSMELVPAQEFDALFYVDTVRPPTYSIP